MQIVNHRLVEDDGTPYPFVETPNMGGELKPRWLVMHHTASGTATAAIGWFATPQSKVSAHVVIDKRGGITQLVPFDRQAWHAGNSRWKGVEGLNRHSIAIELENRGALSGDPGNWRFAKHPVPDAEVLVAKHKSHPGVRGWDRYPPEQIRAAQELAALLVGTYGLEDVLGHDDISPGRKLDPGPAFPMESFRSALGFAPLAEEPADPPALQQTVEEPAQQGKAPATEPATGVNRFRVDADVLNVRSGPGPSDPTVPGSPLPRGIVVDVLETSGAWRRVAASGSVVNGVADVTGWVSEAFLAPAVDEDPAAPGPVPQVEAAEAVARLVHDHVGEGRITLKDDRLNIAPEVRALCQVLVAEKSRPPISVGLFGDWGTGKSFFMEVMHDYIRALTEKSREAVAKGDESSFCTDVVQIRFNAWHYMDSNLWASLAARIFDGLWQAVRENEPEKQPLLMQKLAESEGVLAEMEAGRRAAESDLGEQREKLTRLAEARNTVQARLGRQVGAAVRAGMEKAAGDPVFTARVDEVERLTGLPSGSLSPEAVPARIAELRSRAGRVRALWSSLGSGSRALVAAAFLLVAVGVPLLATLLAGQAALFAPLAALVAGVTALAARVGPWLSRVPAVLARLEEANGVVQRQVQLETEKERQREIADQQELLRLEQAVSRTREAEAEAASRVQALKKEIDDLRSGRQLQRFLQERGSGDDYRRHLGIVSLIRNDFERLSQLLRGLEDEGPQEGMPNIDRIILYIDDLDRCPERRVVEVLQAVHLLLAFPLFVVVVGVDSRWLLLSLEDHYAALRGRARGGNGPPRRLSTPQNYLEKIFQIPFTLRPMEPAGFGKLMGSLVTVRSADEPATDQKRVAGEHVQPEGGAVGDPPPNLVVLPREEHDAAGLPRDESDESGGEEGGEAHEIDLTPPALELEAWEAGFMRALHPLIGSPRSAKRFVNVYQFIRARLDGQALDRFRGTEDGGEHQVAALLLAALVGFPRESRPLFGRLMAPGDPAGTWWALVDEETAVPDLSVDGDEGRIRFARAMKAVRSACTFPDSAGPFRDWAPTIVRFSFNRAHSGAEE